MPLSPTDWSPKPYTDPFTARAGAAVLLTIAAGFLFVGVRALGTGCISLMRGRHGPGVLHCAPETAYWVATTTLLLLGPAVALVGWRWLRVARRHSGARSEER